MNDPKNALLVLMKELSERHYHAGWVSTLEYDLWGLVQCADPDIVEVEEVASLKALSDAAGGWWVWADTDTKFLTMGEWLSMFDERIRFLGQVSQ